MSRTAWHDLIDGDIEWLLKQPGGDERNHIVETLRRLRRYGPPKPAGLEPANPASPTYTEDRVAELYQRGYTGTEIAHRLRIPQTRAYTILRKAGITRRRSGPRHGRGYKAGR